jgi:hypothetical protein
MGRPATALEAEIMKQDRWASHDPSHDIKRGVFRRSWFLHLSLEQILQDSDKLEPTIGVSRVPIGMSSLRVLLPSRYHWVVRGVFDQFICLLRRFWSVEIRSFKTRHRVFSEKIHRKRSGIATLFERLQVPIPDRFPFVQDV